MTTFVSVYGRDLVGSSVARSVEYRTELLASLGHKHVIKPLDFRDLVSVETLKQVFNYSGEVVAIVDKLHPRLMVRYVELMSQLGIKQIAVMHSIPYNVAPHGVALTTDYKAAVFFDEVVVPQKVFTQIIKGAKVAPPGYFEGERLDYNSSSTCFVTASDLVEARRIDALINAFSIVKARGRKASLDIYGRGSWGAGLKQLAELTAAPVRFMGYSNDRASIYRDKLAYISASATESFGFSMLDALGYGVPVVGVGSPFNYGLLQFGDAQLSKLNSDLDDFRGLVENLADIIEVMLDNPVKPREIKYTKEYYNQQWGLIFS